MKKISILCTDPAHPVNEHLEAWSREWSGRAEVEIVRDYRDLSGGDILFLISCHQIIRKATRDLYRFTLVIHASALPEGRGMSPHVWQIVEGRNRLTVTLLNAEDALDSGDIWRQAELELKPTDLHDEIHEKLFRAETELMTWAVENCGQATPRAQSGEGSYYRKRVPADSEVDPDAPLAASFNLLRIADPDRYPAFFTMHGQKYRIRIDKIRGENDRD